MLRLVKDNPLQALELLKKNAGKFSAFKYRKVRANYDVMLHVYPTENIDYSILSDGEIIPFSLAKEIRVF